MAEYFYMDFGSNKLRSLDGDIRDDAGPLK
jgi:hypothetical protein